jgi:hypothetical protein
MGEAAAGVPIAGIVVAFALSNPANRNAIAAAATNIVFGINSSMFWFVSAQT